MDKNFLSPSEQRRADILAHSTEVLGNMPHTYGTQSFILSDKEAVTIGEGVHTRNHRLIRETIGVVQDEAVKDYIQTSADECIGVWNNAAENIFGEGTTINELLLSPETRELLNIALTGSHKTQLGLDTTEYIKLLESIAITTMPLEGFRNYQDSRRSRTGGSLDALYNRSLSLLDSYASAEPGIRTVRTDLLSGDGMALQKYLASSVKARCAQESVTKLVELSEEDLLREKAALSFILLDRQSEETIEVDGLLHVLSWTMLNGRDEDRDTKHRRVRRIIEMQSQTELQKKRVKDSWCPERLDFLIEIAEGAVKEGRRANMFISNRFEDGAGVYVAVELDNPNDPLSKIVFADNPIAGNALYVVDEAKLSNEGRENSWLNVLGSSRRIARERGAIRKYHTKNWKDILPQILSMGEIISDEAPTVAAIAPAVPENTESPVREALSQIERFEILRKRSEALVASAQKLIK